VNAAMTSKIQSNEIFKGIYSINLNDLVFSYLIVGKEKALLIDTGWGTVDLKEHAQQLANVPIVAANSHGHLDHIQGNYQFENIFIRDEDVFMLKNDFTEEKRAPLIKRFGAHLLPKGLTEDAWIKAKISKITSLNDIHSFDLGERSIEIVHTPGHTLGSVCFLDKKEGVIFSGDSLWEGDIMLHFNSSTKLDIFLISLQILLSKSETMRFILPGHGKIPVKIGLLKNVISAVEKILSKEVGSERHLVFNRSCLIGKFDYFNILYQKNSL
jgi:hydroxyacylglutathione hydrolase